MEGLTNEQLNRTSTLFREQTYKKWRLVMPAKNLASAPHFEEPRIVLMK